MKMMIFVFIFSLSSIASAQFSIHVRNQIYRSNQAIEAGDKSIYTRNELHAALQELAKEQAAYDANRYIPTPPELRLRVRPFSVPDKWKQDPALNAVAEVVFSYRAGLYLNPVAARRAYIDLMERGPLVILSAEENELVYELVKIYSAPDDDGRPTRSLFTDTAGRGEGARVEREKTARAVEAQRGISKPLAETLGFPLDSIYGVETIIDM